MRNRWNTSRKIKKVIQICKGEEVGLLLVICGLGELTCEEKIGRVITDCIQDSIGLPLTRLSAVRVLEQLAPSKQSSDICFLTYFVFPSESKKDLDLPSSLFLSRY